MIIDFRIRPPFKSFLDMGFYADLNRVARYTSNFCMELAPSVRDYSMSLLFEEMEESGTDKGVIPGRKGAAYLGKINNSDIVDLVGQHPNKFYGLCGVDASNMAEALAEVENTVVNGPLLGVGLEPGVQDVPMYCDDKAIYPLYDYCQNHDIPVIIMGGGGNGPDITYSMPQYIEHVCVDFPKLTIVNSHGGFPWVNEILFTAMRRPNLYLCPDMYMFNMPGADQYVTAANGFLKDRFIYGTAYPFIDLRIAVSMFKEMPFKKEVWDNVMGKNALRALKLQ